MRISRKITLPLSLALVAGVMAFAAGSAVAQPSSKPFEIVPGSFKLVPSSAQAGGHEDLVTTFDFAHTANGKTDNDVNETVVNLPAGFTGNNTAVPTCSVALLVPETTNRGAECPPDSQVGTITLDIAGEHGSVLSQFPVYNMEVTSPGIAAELGFNAVTFSQVLPITVRPSDSGLTVTAHSIVATGEVHDITVTIWGVPAAAEHDAERGKLCYQAANSLTAECFGGGETVDIPLKPFLSDPTSCGSFTVSMKADSWEEQKPESWLQAPVTEAGPLSVSSEVGPITGCERVQFNPSLEVQPSTRAAESPTGLDVSLVVPQNWEKAETLATSNLKGTKVTLPEGFTINPGAGSGLGACSPRQYESETFSSLPGEGCPAESKIGSIEIETPVLAEKIPGAVYVATPYDNPFPEPGHPRGSLLALYIVAKNPQRGIIIKVAGKIEPNPVTGQLTTTFAGNPEFEGIPASEGTPQQPFSKFTLKFRPGATAPLVSPATCGTYSTQGELTPWSAPAEPRFITSQPFAVTEGVHEGPCPAGGVPPFKPEVVSGTDNNAASSYSPFYLRIERQDGEQEITRFSTTLPPGLTGNLSGIPFCPEAGIEAAKNVTGAEEEADPSCPAASEIGHTIVSAGVGTVFAQTPGRVYLAGPYHGAPLSIVSITSAKVGPFDLGTVVIRFALDINPVTAQVEVSASGSDPIPHIIRGIVVHVREVRVYMSREKFILNPTSCDPMSISETIDGAGADPANPAGQVPVTATAPFQAVDCSSLKFKPGFSVSTSGRTSKADGASLVAKLTVPAALGTQSNIAKVKVDLPVQLPSRLTTLQKACLAATFDANPAACPAASVIGRARAITPILPVPIEGPVYFVSHGGEAFPSLTMVLQGYGITIDLTASTFISKAGITSSTFNEVPDQPVTSFEIYLPEGKYSALAANGNLCSVTKTVTVEKKVTVRVKGHRRTVTRKVKQTQPATLVMPTAFVGQNGAEIHQSTPIAVSGCAQPKRAAVKQHKEGNARETGHRQNKGRE